MTETTVCTHRTASDDISLGSIGKLVSNTKAKVDNIPRQHIQGLGYGLNVVWKAWMTRVYEFIMMISKWLSYI